MIFKRLRKLVQENRESHRINKNLHNKTFAQLKELEWAHIYHDSLRGTEWLEKLPLNIGRWAGNYSFFYVLNRVLSDFKPNNILEFGLGESSKFVSAFLDNLLPNSKHLIIEHDAIWYKKFQNNFKLSTHTSVEICPLYKQYIFDFEVNSYSGLKDVIKQKYDLYIVDGPFGSEHFSRYDIVCLANEFTNNDEFIILIDDYHRVGEKETVKELLNLFKKKNITIYWGEYSGNKSVFVLGTEKYKSIQSF